MELHQYKISVVYKTNTMLTLLVQNLSTIALTDLVIQQNTSYNAPNPILQAWALGPRTTTHQGGTAQGQAGLEY